MQIHVFDTPEAVARAAARRLADAVCQTPRIVLGLAAGQTPLGTYAELRRLCAAGQVDFSQARMFNLDEFAGVGAGDPASFRSVLERHLFSGINVPRSHIHALDGAAPDLDAECERYEREIERAGGLDLVLLGIGANGHIGFNEPGVNLLARTHRAALHDATRRANAAAFGGDPARVPREALSMGMGTILKAHALVMVALGARKARAVERMVGGPVTTRLPASFLQLHRRAELFLDRSAASRLR